MYLTQGDKPKFKSYPLQVTRLNYFYHSPKSFSFSLNYLYDYEWYSPLNTKGKGNHLLNIGVRQVFNSGVALNIELINALNETNDSPMISNAGGRDLSPGTPSQETRTFVAELSYQF